MQLNIRFIEAKDIAKMDTFGKTDAYCQFGLNGKVNYKTKIIKNSMTPKWNEDFTLPITNAITDSLHLVMKDHDIAHDDLMAVLDINMSSLPPGVLVDHWYPLQPVDKVPKGGLIHLLLHLAAKTDSPFVNKPMSPLPNTPLKLHVRLIEGKEIPKMDTVGATDAYCILSLSNSQKQRSDTKQNTMLPKWNQDFHFDVRNPNTDEFQILMRDQDISRDDDISTWGMPVRYIPFCALADQWIIMQAVPKVKKGGRVHILLHLCPPDYDPFVPRPPPAPQQVPPQGPPMGQQVPQQPPMGYPQQQLPQQGYGLPATQAPGYGVPVQQIPGYGAPPQQQYNSQMIALGAPPPPMGYGVPVQQIPGYGAPPQQMPGYGAPPQPTSGYGVPPQQMQGYGAPPQQMPGYGAPPQQMPGYGAPPQPASGYPTQGYPVPSTPGQPQGTPPPYGYGQSSYPGY